MLLTYGLLFLLQLFFSFLLYYYMTSLIICRMHSNTKEPTLKGQTQHLE